MNTILVYGLAGLGAVALVLSQVETIIRIIAKFNGWRKDRQATKRKAEARLQSQRNFLRTVQGNIAILSRPISRRFDG